MVLGLGLGWVLNSHLNKGSSKTFASHLKYRKIAANDLVNVQVSKIELADWEVFFDAGTDRFKRGIMSDDSFRPLIYSAMLTAMTSDLKVDVKIGDDGFIYGLEIEKSGVTSKPVRDRNAYIGAQVTKIEFADMEVFVGSPDTRLRIADNSIRPYIISTLLTAMASNLTLDIKFNESNEITSLELEKI